MVWQDTPYTIPLMVAGAGMLLATFFLWRQQGSAASKIVLFITLLAVGLLLATAFKLSFVDMPTQVFWHLVQQSFITLIPTAWLFLTLQTLGYYRWLGRRYVAALCFVPVVTTLLVVTNPLHGLFWTHYSQETVDSVVMLQQQRVFGSMADALYNYGVLAAAIVLAVRVFLRRGDPRRIQARALLLVAAPPVAFILLYELNQGITSLNHLIALAALITSPLIIWGSRYYGAGNIIPVARAVVMDYISDAVIVLGQDGLIIDLNPAARRILRPAASAAAAAAAGECVGRPLRDFWPAEAAPLLADIMAATDVIKQEVVLAHAAEQRTYDMHVSPVFNWHGAVSSRVIVLHDISERINYQAALELLNTHLEGFVVERTLELENERAQLQAIIDSMGEGLIYTEGDTCRVNLALAAITGYTVEALNGPLSNLMRLISADDTLWELLHGAGLPFDAAGVWQGEVRLRRQDGTQFAAELTVAPVVAPVATLLTPPGDQRANAGATVTLVRDISQQKILRAQKDHFVTNASHQLRTPMTNIMTRLYLARRQPERLDEHLRVLEETAESMTSLIAQMLDISYFEQQAILLQREDVVLQDLLTSVFDGQLPRAAAKRITLACEMAAGAVHARVDTWRLRDALTYLLAYAIDYSREGSTVQVQLVTVDNHVQLTIQDSSPGTPRELLPHIFEPFFTASEGNVKATGMELTIAKAIVEAHGGTLTAESELGHGTTFTLQLPLPRSEAPPA